MRTAVVNFNGGQYSPKIDARSDTEKYRGGCREHDNMIPTIFGGSERRPGTEFVSTKNVFSAILSAIFSIEEKALCYEDSAVVSNYSTLLSQISCLDNEILCYENEVVSESENTGFLSRIMCYEDEVLFYEGEIVTN